MVKPKYHLFVCTSCTITGQQRGFCANKESVGLVQQIMEEIEERELSSEVMVTNTGCFGICSSGPVVVVYPEGIWYKNITKEDITTIFDEHIEQGNPVKNLMI